MYFIYYILHLIYHISNTICIYIYMCTEWVMPKHWKTSASLIRFSSIWPWPWPYWWLFSNCEPGVLAGPYIFDLLSWILKKQGSNKTPGRKRKTQTPIQISEYFCWTIWPFWYWLCMKNQFDHCLQKSSTVPRTQRIFPKQGTGRRSRSHRRRAWRQRRAW